jgi:hypothetical protein
VVINRRDVTRIVDVGERVGGKENEIGGIAGGDKADVDGGIERVEELARGACGDGDGFEWGETGGDKIFELAVFAETGNAARIGAGIGAEGYVRARVVNGLDPTVAPAPATCGGKNRAATDDMTA